MRFPFKMLGIVSALWGGMELSSCREVITPLPLPKINTLSDTAVVHVKFGSGGFYDDKANRDAMDRTYIKAYATVRGRDETLPTTYTQPGDSQSIMMAGLVPNQLEAQLLSKSDVVVSYRADKITGQRRALGEMWEIANNGSDTLRGAFHYMLLTGDRQDVFLERDPPGNHKPTTVFGDFASGAYLMLAKNGYTTVRLDKGSIFEQHIKFN